MSEEADVVKLYGRALGLEVQPRTVLVEGVTDVDMFAFAAQLEEAASGSRLLDGLAIIAAGQGDAGGTQGVVRELLAFRGIARTVLLRNGSPKYRCVALFDNDPAGKYAVKTLQGLDRSIIEYKDVFRLWPVMPMGADLDPTSLRVLFETHNAKYRALDWELEDLLPRDVVEAFLIEYPQSVARTNEIGGYVHREFTRDGKARIHRFVKDHCLRRDLLKLIDVLKALRSYLGLK